jgi:HD-GYP domain-containing protein (c-di-GMP phosphodiesterase class II)
MIMDPDRISYIAKNDKKDAPDRKEDRRSGVRFSDLYKQRFTNKADLPKQPSEKSEAVDGKTRKNADPGDKPQQPPERSAMAESPVRQENRLDEKNIYLALLQCVREIRDRVKNNNAVDVEPALSLIDRIIASPETISGINPAMLLKVAGNEDYYILQPVHTMIYALKMGLRLNYRRENLRELSLAALLQNVGMFLLPEDLVNKTEQLTDEEMLLIKRHPETGRDLLLPIQNKFSAVVEAVYQHHEREGGQGYPRGLKGEQISEYAKIIGICDSYEAMTHNRPHKKALLQFTSVRQLIGDKTRLFPSLIVKTFLEEMSLYPVGSYVKLNSGIIGIVIGTNRSQAVKPVVRILFDGLGNRIANGDALDMANNNVLNIVDVVAESDLPQ